VAVAVIPTDAETTACIAACYRAKARGVRTGTPVWEARKLCPGIVCVVADHRRYVVMHNRVVAAVNRVVPVESVMSIDEMSCRLVGDERKPDAAAVTAAESKRRSTRWPASTCTARSASGRT
jgi:DNA polymerase-4